MPPRISEASSLWMPLITIGKFFISFSFSIVIFSYFSSFMSVCCGREPMSFSYIIFAALFTQVFSHAVYSAYIHPLSSFPGPKLWSTTYLFRHISNMCGELDWSIMAMHEKYGEVIRFSPSELSFISEQSWKDIYASKEVPLMKDPEWYGIVKLGSDGAPSIFTASPDNHPRIRKYLLPAFSEKALREQEPSIQSYVDLFIEKMKAIAASGQPADMVKWYNFTTFDLIGDLAIGKSFSCLNESNYHSWVSNIFKSIQIGPYIRTMATYTDIKRLMRLLAPKAVKAARAKHEQYVQVHTQERIDQGVCEERQDFISYFLRTRDSDKTSFTDKEIAANTGFIILAGSETTATALSGTTYYLLMNPEALARATTEVRNAFLSEADITFAQTAASLPYITACLTEGLRLYPPGPGGAPRRTPRELNARVATIAGYKIPPNTTVSTHTLSASRSSLNFYLPNTFAPERWLPLLPNSPFLNDRRGASQPFGLGPMYCPGKNLAYAEMRLMLARVLWRFDLRLAGDEGKRWLERQKMYTLWEKGPLMVRLQDRTV